MMEEGIKRGHLIELCPIEEVLDWSGKLEALGQVLGDLAYYENALESKTQALYDHTETLGRIIADYARAINETTERNHGKWSGRIEWEKKKATEAVSTAAGA